MRVEHKVKALQHLAAIATARLKAVIRLGHGIAHAEVRLGLARRDLALARRPLVGIVLLDLDRVVARRQAGKAIRLLGTRSTPQRQLGSRFRAQAHGHALGIGTAVGAQAPRDAPHDRQLGQVDVQPRARTSQQGGLHALLDTSQVPHAHLHHTRGLERPRSQTIVIAALVLFASIHALDGHQRLRQVLSSALDMHIEPRQRSQLYGDRTRTAIGLAELTAPAPATIRGPHDQTLHARLFARDRWEAHPRQFGRITGYRCPQLQRITAFFTLLQVAPLQLHSQLL